MSRLPAEWEHQSGVQLTWPHCDTEWYELEKVLECYVEIASAILRFEPLMIVTRDIEECKADIARITSAKGLELDVEKIRFYESPLNDTWARDHGGISVFGDGGQKYLYDFVFNGWGLKFASDLDNQITKNIYTQGAFEGFFIPADQFQKLLVLRGRGVILCGLNIAIAKFFKDFHAVSSLQIVSGINVPCSSLQNKKSPMDDITSIHRGQR